MEKRLPLFLFLAFLILFGWNLAFPPPKKTPAPPPAAVAPEAARAAPAAVGDAPPSSASQPAISADEEQFLDVVCGGAGEAQAADGARVGAFHARFTNRGAALLSLELADYVTAVGLDEAQRLDRENWLPLLVSAQVPGGQTGSLVWSNSSPSSRELVAGDLENALWAAEPLAEPEIGIRFRYSPPGGAVVLEKKVVFEPGQWHLRVTLAIENRSAGAARLINFGFTPAAVVPAELGDRFYSEPTAVAIGRARDGDYESAHKAAPGLDESGALAAPAPLTLFGVHNKYFAFLMREAREGTGTIGGAVYAPVRELPEPPSTAPRPFVIAEGSLNLGLPAEGERREWEYVVYAGPKDPEAFVADFAPHEVIIDDDLTVDAIAKGLLRVLRFFHGIVGNWGWAIILLTLCVRVVLFPLNRRSQTAMARYQKKMKRVQPRLEDAKKRFANDPQKLREAQARIMQEEGAFPPLGGCLPIFLQMPIFFGLFSALRVSFDLRQAPFHGWITDLSRPDRLHHLGWKLPLLPDVEYLNVLPILMVVLWILQQMGMPKPADEQAARMQKMMMFMPALFGVMLYNYAAGLSLYMITTSGMSIVEQRVIKKIWPLDETEPEPKARKGCGPFSGALQNLAEKHQEQMKRMQAMQAEQRRAEQRKKRK